jgi:hypothetical protein
MVMNRARWLGVVILVIVLVVVFLYLTRGFLWSFQETSFQGLLNSLPEPPKWVPETNRLSTSPYVPDGYRYYDVAGQHAQVVQFFNQGTLEPDWQLVREQNRLTPGSDNSYMKTTSLLFSNDKRYCLEIRVGTLADRQGTQLHERVWVHIRVAEGDECSYNTPTLPKC